jgi:SagB-type dehydrogenase family enzyme
MANETVEVARRYHELTKHSPESVRRDLHFLDWNNQPLPFKLYRGLEPLPLPAAEARAAPAALDVLMGGGRTGVSVDLDSLSRVLFYTAGVTKRLRHAGGEMAFRAAACTGALYHIDVYVAAGDVSGLDAGLYHYGPARHVLTRLRDGDWREFLFEATGDEPRVSEAEAVLLFTTTFWRNAWKYRARAYRHAFWDSGTMIANLFAEAGALELRHHLILGFADEAVNRLLDVDPEKEASVALIAVGERGASAARSPSAPPEPLDLTTEPLSPSEVDYPLIREMHEASSLANGAEARRWRERAGSSFGTIGEPAHPLVPLDAVTQASDTVEQVIRKRGSSRRFAQAPIAKDALATILRGAIRRVPADALPPESLVCDAYVIANAVEGLSPGAYCYHPESQSLELLRKEALRRQARFLDLEQDLAGDAAVNVYLLVDLEGVLDRWGNRGYRLAQIEGGILGGRMYLAAYALGLGATGLTFYDDEVTKFFSPHAKGKAVMFLTAIGVPMRRRVLFQE